MIMKSMFDDSEYIIVSGFLTSFIGQTFHYVKCSVGFIVFILLISTKSMLDKVLIKPIDSSSMNLKASKCPCVFVLFSLPVPVSVTQNYLYSSMYIEDSRQTSRRQGFSKLSTVTKSMKIVMLYANWMQHFSLNNK